MRYLFPRTIKEALKYDILLHIDNNHCIGCGLCVSVCPTNALSQTYY